MTSLKRWTLEENLIVIDSIVNDLRPDVESKVAEKIVVIK